MGEAPRLFMARQMALTQAERTALPALYTTDGQGEDAIAQVHYFTPSMDWLVTEYDGNDTMFGYVLNRATGDGEWGYISLSELWATHGRFCGVERDYHWTASAVRNYY